MRKSMLGALVAAIVLAVGVAVIAFWLPAYHSSQAKKWNQAGESALTHLALPGSFQVHNDGICSIRLDRKCFVAPGDPKDVVAPLEAALRPLATAPMQARCHNVPLPNSPMTCAFDVRVKGSNLLVNLFARIVHDGKPVAQATYNGSYVEITAQHH